MRASALIMAAAIALGVIVAPALPAPTTEAGATLAARPAPVPVAPEQAELNLRDAARPPRDLFRLAEQVKLKVEHQIPRRLRDTPPDYKVGDLQEFWIADQDNKTYFTIKARLLHQTAHVHWWVQEGKNADVARLRESAERFERDVLPLNQRLFGVEASPGIDGDPRITVLLAVTPGAGGYYSASDSYPKLVNSHSNERKMIYMNVDSARPGTVGFDSTLAHEYQHMIHRTVRPGDQGWIDEGMSVLAEKLNGFGNGGGVGAAFMARPGTQLNTWSEDAARAVNHYGASFLWMDYFFGRFGGYDGMRAYLQIPATDRLSFDRYLEQLGQRERFDDVFADWAVANLINDPSVADGRYGYASGATGKTNRVDALAIGASRSGTVNNYGTAYFRLEGQGNAEIAFKGDVTTRVIPTDPRSGAGMWWGNRGDDMNTNLTRTVDLTGVTKATLEVSLWWQIEEGFDYAYVEVSADGGRTWTTLAGRHTTNDNPNGQNLGNGLTGKSGGGEAAAWVREQFDLTPWAGQSVLLRFEYVTDDAVNIPGFAWDDLAIPEIGLTDDAEATGAWTANGFVRLGNVIPERFIVQVVTRDTAGIQVQRLPLDAGAGTLAVGGIGGPGRDVWIVVSGSAEWTTEPVNYTLDIRRAP